MAPFDLHLSAFHRETKLGERLDLALRPRLSASCVIMGVIGRSLRTLTTRASTLVPYPLRGEPGGGGGFFIYSSTRSRSGDSEQRVWPHTEASGGEATGEVRGGQRVEQEEHRRVLGGSAGCRTSDDVSRNAEIYKRGMDRF